MSHHSLNTLTYTALLVVVISLLSSCAITVDSNHVGRDFIRLDTSRLQFGVTTKNDITALMGKPSYTLELKSMGRHSLVYRYFSRMAEAVAPDQVASRLQTFHFDLNEKLTGVDYVSSFRDDSTYFDIEKASRIKQGDPRQRVIKLLGPPSGVNPIPPPESELGEVISYSYPVTKYLDKTYHLLTYNVLIQFDKQGNVATVDVMEPAI